MTCQLKHLALASEYMESYLSPLMIDHDVMWLHVPMHDSFAMAEVQSFEQLVNVVADIIINESRVQSPEVGIVDIFENETRCFALTIANDVQQRNNIGSS